MKWLEMKRRQSLWSMRNITTLRVALAGMIWFIHVHRTSTTSIFYAHKVQVDTNAKRHTGIRMKRAGHRE